MFGTCCWGVAIGIALIKGGPSSMQALGMVILVFSGHSAGRSPATDCTGRSLARAWLTALAAKLRFVVYSAVVANEFRGRPMAQRVLIGWMTTDTGLAAAGLRRSARGRGDHRADGVNPHGPGALPCRRLSWLCLFRVWRKARFRAWQQGWRCCG